MAICRGIRLDGAPCEQRAIRGTEYCWYHGPAAGPSPSSCVVCRDLRQAEIEALLVTGFRDPDVGRRFRLSPSAVRYHRLRHLPPGSPRAKGGR